MKSGVGIFDSPKYSLYTPSMVIASSAISRIRECGTRNADAASSAMERLGASRYRLLDLYDWGWVLTRVAGIAVAILAVVYRMAQRLEGEIPERVGFHKT